jgi:hypothetical protein
LVVKNLKFKFKPSAGDVVIRFGGDILFKIKKKKTKEKKKKKITMFVVVEK